MHALHAQHSLQAMKPYESAAVPESERIEQGAEELEARFRWAAPPAVLCCAVLCCAVWGQGAEQLEARLNGAVAVLCRSMLQGAAPHCSAQPFTAACCLLRCAAPPLFCSLPAAWRRGSPSPCALTWCRP